MLMVRTNPKAVVTGAIIVALFTLEVVRTGLVMTAQDRSSLDAWIVTALATGAIYAILFLLGHDQLRRHDLRSRGAYAGIGAIAAVPPFLLAMGSHAVGAAAEAGTLSAVLVCPLIGGALMGFLYHRRAGYETEGDDVGSLAAATSDAASPAPAYVSTDSAEYFSGPFVVCSSLGANAIASLLAATAFILAGTLAARAQPYASPLTEFMAHNGAGLTILQGVLGMAIPIGVLLAMTHAYLRARGKYSYHDYALAGLIGPGIFSVLMAMTGMSWFALIYLLQFLAPSLLGMLVYRRLAGLEPAPLPDDIEVSDRRTLVGEDHARRRMARIIDTSR
ncbi:MAG: hypothetical protein EOO77_00735 [Oxalobacteraceae bacterium]|nr:MAG: hypothetical protein EOO77_00735 [Oxalobacteraceae bacterium]